MRHFAFVAMICSLSGVAWGEDADGSKKPSPAAEVKLADTYRVTVTTPRGHDAGTDDDVHIHIEDSDNNEIIKLLDDTSRNDFEQGSRDTFTFQDARIQPIERIGFHLERANNDTNWRWKCGTVRVENRTTGYEVFCNFDRWINQRDVIFWYDTRLNKFVLETKDGKVVEEFTIRN